MNFFQLVDRTLQEAGISGRLQSLAAAQGEHARVVDWVRAAYLMIQGERSWNWLWRQAAVNLLAGRHHWDPASEWGIYALRWAPHSLRLYETAVGPSDTQLLALREYGSPSIATVQTTRPSSVMVLPDRRLWFNAILDKNYTFLADYYSTAESLRDDGDTPSMPEQYHEIVVWQAVMLYADYEEAGALRTVAQAKRDILHAQMVHTETPAVTMGAFA